MVTLIRKFIDQYKIYLKILNEILSQILEYKDKIITSLQLEIKINSKSYIFIWKNLAEYHYGLVWIKYVIFFVLVKFIILYLKSQFWFEIIISVHFIFWSGKKRKRKVLFKKRSVMVFIVTSFFMFISVVLFLKSMRKLNQLYFQKFLFK